jgi:hypothetical protein
MNKKTSRLLILLFFSFSLLLISGCSDEESVSFEEKLRIEYDKNHRLDRFYELQERYDGYRVILMINEEDDAMWITNFTLWLVFSILPDIPQALAGGGVIGIFYGIAWWLGVTLTGGGILAVLAWLGAMFGGIPGVPPAICGIVYLGVMFVVLAGIFGIAF